MTNRQTQEGGNLSTNIQAREINIIQGMSVSEIREIALDVFKANFLILSGQAAETARARAEELTETFLKQVQADHNFPLDQAKDPDFQYALFAAQREYARSGDKEMGDLLVDLLVDRTKHANKTIIQIVLTESLTVAPKLTTDQLAALSVVFNLRYSVNRNLSNLVDLGTYLAKYLEPFVVQLSKKDAGFQHLVYSGCGTIDIGEITIPRIFRDNYPGLFSRGFSREMIAQQGVTVAPGTQILRPCLHNPALLQVNVMNEEVLRQEGVRLNLPPAEIDGLANLAAQSLMNDVELKNYLIGAHPYLSTLIDVWDNSFIKNLTLTSVGIAIGHANAKRTVGKFTDLSIWIN